MSLSKIIAHFECDGCGKPFTINMDAADKTEGAQTLIDLAEDEVRDRGSLQDGVFATVVYDLHLCGACAGIAAKVGQEEVGYAPRDQIVAALNERAATNT